jgi:hypothetical protein
MLQSLAKHALAGAFLLNTQVSVQQLAAEAAVHASKGIAF